MKILIPEMMLPAPLARLQTAHDVHYQPTLIDSPADLLEAVRDADCLIVRNRTQVRGDLLNAAAQLRLVGRLGVGLDNIDLDACKARGITVVPAVGANARSVAEYVITTAMMMMRGAYGMTDPIAAGKWPRAAALRGREIAGMTLGIVGFGSIGQLTAQLARRMDMQVLACSPSLAPDAPELSAVGADLLPLDELLARSDVVSLHMPLTDATRGLINADRLARMRPGAVLINTARAGVVVQAALIDALRTGRLQGAAIDVFEQEPLPAGTAWADVPGLLLTPHIAGVTVDSERRVGELIADKVLALLR